LPDLAQYVPRADYDSAVARAKTAEDKITDGEKAVHQKDVDEAIAAALKEGKITPATKDFYVANCATTEGLEQFKAFASAAPVIGDPSNLDNKPPTDDPKTLTESEKAIAMRCGLTDEQFLASKQD
jgi:phage I-like protein